MSANTALRNVTAEHTEQTKLICEVVSISSPVAIRVMAIDASMRCWFAKAMCATASGSSVYGVTRDYWCHDALVVERRHREPRVR